MNPETEECCREDYAVESVTDNVMFLARGGLDKKVVIKPVGDSCEHYRRRIREKRAEGWDFVPEGTTESSVSAQVAMQSAVADPKTGRPLQEQGMMLTIFRSLVFRRLVLMESDPESKPLEVVGNEKAPTSSS